MAYFLALLFIAAACVTVLGPIAFDAWREEIAAEERCRDVGRTYYPGPPRLCVPEEEDFALTLPRR